MSASWGQSSTRSASSSFPRCCPSEAGFCFSPMRRHIAKSRPALNATAQALGLTLEEGIVEAGDDIDRALRDARSGEGVAGVNVLSSAFLFALRARTIALTAELGMPAIYQWPETSEEGGLMAYGPTPPRRLPPGHRPCREDPSRALSREISRLNSRPDLHSVSTSRLPRRSASRSRRPSSPAPDEVVE